LLKLQSLAVPAIALIIVSGCASNLIGTIPVNTVNILDKAHLQFDEVSYSVNARPQVTLGTIDGYFNDIGWTRISSNELADTSLASSREAYNLIRDIAKARLPYLQARDLKGDTATIARIKRTQQWQDWSTTESFEKVPSVGSVTTCRLMSGPEINASVIGVNNKFKDVLDVCVSDVGDNSIVTVQAAIHHFVSGRFQDGAGSIGVLWLPWLDGTRVAKSVKALKATLHGSLHKSLPRDSERGAELISPVVLTSSGSGFVVSVDGYIATNHHVIEGCSFVESQNERLEIIAIDKLNDLAVLKSKKKFDDYLILNTNAPNLSDNVRVYGYPLVSMLGENLSATGGEVSSLSGYQGDFSQFTISAPIQPGNSGGPVLNTSNEVIGIIIATLDNVSLSKRKGIFSQNVNFVIRANLLKNMMSAHGIVSEDSYNSAPPNFQKTTKLLKCYK
jgi:S1-C subfamily serine protease